MFTLWLVITIITLIVVIATDLYISEDQYGLTDFIIGFILSLLPIINIIILVYFLRCIQRNNLSLKTIIITFFKNLFK